jgi:hypothetical protein
MSEYLTRDETAAELTEYFGLPVTKSTLEKLAEKGEGPPYVIILGKAAYPRVPLREWAEAVPQPPRARAQAARLGAAAPLAA